MLRGLCGIQGWCVQGVACRRGKFGERAHRVQSLYFKKKPGWAIYPRTCKSADKCGDVRVTRTIFIGRCSTFDHGAATVASFKYFMFAG